MLKQHPWGRGGPAVAGGRRARRGLADARPAAARARDPRNETLETGPNSSDRNAKARKPEPATPGTSIAPAARTNGQFLDCEITHFTIPPIKNGG